MSALEAGQTVDRYTVEAQLGTGGMATVYRVRHTTLGSIHALKVLHVEGRGITERLLAEGRVQAGLDHPNALTVTDVIDVDGRPGLVMEFVAGGTLEDWVAADDPPREARLAVFRDVCDAVATAHAQGWIHRDLKPANVLVKRTNDRILAKVADFGLVKALTGDQPHDGPRTRQGMPMGTPGYMAPEQIESAAGVDARADVYSLGCILVWLLTGEDAFGADTMLDTFAKVAAGEHKGLPADDPLHAVVEKALAIDREDRFPDAGALREALTAPENVRVGPKAVPSRNRPTTVGQGNPPGPTDLERMARRAVPIWALVLVVLLAAGSVTGGIVLGVSWLTVSSITGPAPCELGEPGRLGWIAAESKSGFLGMQRVPNPVELTVATTVYTEGEPAEVEGEPAAREAVCTLPAGAKVTWSRRHREGEQTWVSVDAERVALPE